MAKDLSLAFVYYEKAALQGERIACNNLGYLYEKGFGCQRDPVKAAEWYEKASEMGLPLASYHLAVLYETGQGVKRDRKRAAALYQKAADGGVAPAAEALKRLQSGGLLSRLSEAVNPRKHLKE